MTQDLAVRPSVDYLEPSRFEQVKAMAEYFAKSDLVPSHFQGKPANVFIALQYAGRMDLDPFMVMQSLYVVHGRPSWEGKFLIGLVNNSGLFDEPLEFVFDGQGDDYGCRAQAKKGRKLIVGPKVTRKMVQGEKWDADKVYNRGKQNEFRQPSKWKTMEDLMFRYRAGSYFVNTICPQVKLGLPTREELEDIGPQVLMEETASGVYAPQEDPEVATNFWKLVDEAAGRPDMDGDELFNRFFLETARALGKSAYDTMLEALSAFGDFWAAYERWSSKPASSEPPQATISPDPGENPSGETANEAPPASQSQGPQNNEGVRPVTQAKLVIIEQLLKKSGYAREMLLQDYDVKELDELADEAADNVIEFLRKVK